jgi:hypothetical protein
MPARPIVPFAMSVQKMCDPSTAIEFASGVCGPNELHDGVGIWMNELLRPVPSTPSRAIVGPRPLVPYRWVPSLAKLENSGAPGTGCGLVPSRFADSTADGCWPGPTMPLPLLGQ